jgi:hypothetical protein
LPGICCDFGSLKSLLLQLHVGHQHARPWRFAMMLISYFDDNLRACSNQWRIDVSFVTDASCDTYCVTLRVGC